MRISDWSSDVCSSDLYTADSEVSGKNVGTDLAEGKPTLPLIHAMKHGSKDETALIRDAIMHGRVEQLEAVLKAVESTGAIPYTCALAERHSLKAAESLGDLPDSDRKSTRTNSSP